MRGGEGEEGEEGEGGGGGGGGGDSVMSLPIWSCLLWGCEGTADWSWRCVGVEYRAAAPPTTHHAWAPGETWLACRGNVPPQC